MRRSLRHSVTIIVAQLLLLLTPVSLRAQSSSVTISTPEQIKIEFDSVPCNNTERLRAVEALFEKMGAPASDVSIDKHKDVENLVVRKHGASQEIIVVGAHYDKVADGCGAIDNWSGIVTLVHLYKSLQAAALNKTILFVAFGKEEKGLVGSHAMVEAIARDQAAQYCEMINIDSLGLAAPQVADNLSNKKLGTFTADLAKEMKVPFAHAAIENADGDSSSFLGKKIPALTIHGLSQNWPTILHSRNDQPSKVNAVSVYLGYRLTLALLIRLDNSPCSAYR
jgi:hypothetical protein